MSENSELFGMPKDAIENKLEFIFFTDDSIGAAIGIEQKLNQVDFTSKEVVSDLNWHFTKFQGLITYCYSVSMGLIKMGLLLQTGSFRT